VEGDALAMMTQQGEESLMSVLGHMWKVMMTQQGDESMKVHRSITMGD
jgi:hypothetical protein